MSNLTKGLILVGVILCIGVGLAVWKKKVGGASSQSFNVITREEIESLLADVAQNNPMLLKRLADDPDLKKQQLDSMRQLMAFASQAQKEGLADDPTNKQELENIRIEILSMNYDKEINKDKGQMPPFGFISEDQIKAYWDEDNQPPQSPGFFQKMGFGKPPETRTHEQEFQDFLDSKIKVLKATNPEMKDREITDEEKGQAREVFAKERIYAREYEQKLSGGELSRDMINKTNLQVKLQQAQFLARLYSDNKADTDKVTDDDINAYIKAHPELDPEQKRVQAQAVLDRIKAGEDFAKVANEVSQDPGNKGPDGQPKGGLYENVKKGDMVAPFEQAALALQPGQVAPELVETDFGFHIIKLERALGMHEGKDGKKEETYDVRHILISTGFKDPEVPNAREVPVKEYVRSKLEKEKSKKEVADLAAANNVQVAEDFTIPQITDEQMQQMRRPQMPGGGPQGGPPQGGPPQGGPPPGAPPPPGGKPATTEPKKPDAKKK